MTNQTRQIETNDHGKLALLTLGLAIALILSAMTSCANNGVAGTARVQVFLTDAPLDLATVSAVNVTITEISLKTVEDANGDTQTLTLMGSDPWTVNLLDYQNGNTVLMAADNVAAGEYNKIRLVVSAAELVRDDDGDPMTPDIVEPIFNPSGKVDITAPFVVSAGTDLSVTLDFDAELSIQVNQTSGNHPYILRPVINLVGVN